MRNVTLRQMKVFAAVARHLSFTRAARELHLTQPAVSQQVKLLQLEVGLPLVRDWYVIHLHDKRLSPIAAAFRAFLLEHGGRIIQKAVGELPRVRRAGVAAVRT